MKYENDNVEGLKADAYQESLEHKNTKIYVIWNKYSETGFISRSPVDNNAGEEWICYFINGEEYE